MSNVCDTQEYRDLINAGATHDEAIEQIRLFNS